MIFAKEPYLLHLLAGSTSSNALDAVKALLDAGSHSVDEREPADNLAPLHVAAAWDNLAMVQLLVHYGADINAVDIDKRRAVDIATGQSRRFLKKFKRKKRLFGKIFTYLFREKPNGKTTEECVDAKPIARSSCPSVLTVNALLPDRNPKIPLPLKEPTTAVSETRRELRSGSTSTYKTAEDRDISIPSRRTASSGKGETDFLSSDKSEAEIIEIANNFSRAESSKSSRPSTFEEIELQNELAKLSIGSLKKKLVEQKSPVGPIDDRNRKYYEKRLAKLTIDVKNGAGRASTVIRYSPALQRKIHDDEFGTRITQTMGDREERQVRDAFLLSDGKLEVSFFCYLIIDPSMIFDPSCCTLKEFISTIFYVGKGNRSRPLQHLLDAYRCRALTTKPSFKKTDSKKLDRIHKLWDMGEGVISLHISHNIHSEEAFVREAGMISAIGLENLTNKKRGNLKGITRTWTNVQLAEFGAMLLSKAHIVFQNERCRPVMEADIAAITSKFL